MRRWLLVLLVAFVPAAAAETWRFAVIGDTPYSDFERRELPRMLEAIADQGVDVVTHIGDFKSGQERCDDTLFEARRTTFEASRVPFVYLPGDNEWTDCERVSNGSYDPLERLQKLRSLFWRDDRSLGQRRIALEQQSPAYPEHARFRLGPVLFVSLNVPGWDNNFGPGAEPRSEFTARNGQVLNWIRGGFARARKEKLSGIVLLMQANPSFDTFARGLPNRGFVDLLELIRREILDFSGQVLLVHGDTHWQRIDHPLRAATGGAIANFTRLESFGYPTMGWVKVVIDTDLPQLYRFEVHPWPPRQP